MDKLRREMLIEKINAYALAYSQLIVFRTFKLEEEAKAAQKIRDDLLEDIKFELSRKGKPKNEDGTD